VNFLKNLFASSGGGSPVTYFYVQPKRCEEVLEVRINLYNDPSLTDGGEYFVRKVVRGTRCPFPAELHVYLDKRRKVINTEVIDGEQVTKEAYQAWLEKKEASKNK
jgi:hypothetical protein